MAMDAKGYFHHLRNYLNTDFYGIPKFPGDEIELKEKIKVGNKKKEFKATLKHEGELFAIKLDSTNNQGNQLPLYHFLDNNGQLWTKRCDFIVFNLVGKKIFVYCLEFKSQHLDTESISGQLQAAEKWCRALLATINIYVNKKCKFELTKLVVSECPEDRLGSYLEENGEFLARDPSVRHFLYKDINGLALNDLNHAGTETVR
jgi:hypothetical protein